jgi:predicted nucleotidyltransferase
MYPSELVQHIVDKLTTVQGLQAIVLGGSWASGAQRPDSDIDLGLYYAANQPLDTQHIRHIANELNDLPNPVVTNLGGWGHWVNGGAWLTIQGQHVDFLYRDIDFVSTILDNCNKGEIQSDYWQQPPYGFHSYIYCAETNMCNILYDPNQIIPTLKAKVALYPQPLKHTIINSFAWSAQFTLQVAQKSTEVYFVAGCLARAITCLVQVLYALNETYFISDKRMYKDVEKFNIKPKDFTTRVDRILSAIGHNGEELVESLHSAETILNEIVALCGNPYQPRY